MAYTFNFLYIAIPTTANNYGAIYIHSPNKTGLSCDWGEEIGSTTFLLNTIEGGNKAFYVYRFSASSYSSNFNTDSPNDSWLDSYNITARSSYTSLQYSSYCVYKYCCAVSSYDYSSLITAIRDAGDTQSPPVYCFYTTTAGYAYNGAWEKWTTTGATGLDKQFKRRQFASNLIKDTSTNIGITSSTVGSRIIRLKSETSSSGMGIGVYPTGSSSTAVNLQNSSYYRGYNFTDGTYSSETLYIAGNNEKVYVLHPVNSSSLTLYAGAKNDSGDYDKIVSYGYWYNGGSSWLTTEWIDDKKYAAITLRNSNIWTYSNISVEAGYRYTFDLHTYSEDGQEGVVVRMDTKGKPGSWNSAISGALTSCTGPDMTRTYTYTSTTATTIYVYFYTDSNAYLGPTTYTPPATYGGTGTYTDTDYTTGDVKITRARVTSTIIFNSNGGTGGPSSSVTATYGQAMPTITPIPTRAGVNGNYGFEGYWDSGGSGGTQYYKADGTSATTWNKTASSVTLYARWRNLLICDAFVYYSDYASGLLSKTDPSSADNRLIIFTSDGAGIQGACGIATHSVYTKVSGGNSITLASGFRCTDGGTPAVSIWAGTYGDVAAFTVLSTGRGIVTNSIAAPVTSIIIDPPIVFGVSGSSAPTSPGISFPRVVTFNTPGGSNYLGATCYPAGVNSVTFGSLYAFTIPIAIYKQTVTAISASVSSKSINVNATTALTVTATYTNGASKMVLTSNSINYDGGNEVEMTQNPTGVISLTNY